MITTLKKRYAAGFAGILLLFVMPIALIAVEIERGSASVENRFIVGPAKVELEVPAGESRQAVIEIENRTGRAQTYHLTTENFSASSDGKGVSLGDSESATSLAPLISFPEKEIALEHGDRGRVVVSVSVPFGEVPGGKFGSVIVAGESDVSSGNINAPVVGQVAVLFFVTVPGDVRMDGSLVSFEKVRSEKTLSGDSAVFRIAYENNGTVHLNPYGGITIRNMFGRVVSTHVVDPWFVLPGSTRTRDIQMEANSLFGWYKATLEHNRGFGDTIDTASVSFVVVGWKSLVFAVVIIVAVVFLVRRFRSK